MEVETTPTGAPLTGEEVERSEALRQSFNAEMKRDPQYIEKAAPSLLQRAGEDIVKGAFEAPG